jgi:ribosomal protein S6
MEIYDNNGRLIESHEVENRDFQLDIKAYQSGTYFIRTIDENNQILTSRLVITNF